MIVCLVSHFFVVGVVGLINRLCWRCCLGGFGLGITRSWGLCCHGRLSWLWEYRFRMSLSLPFWLVFILLLVLCSILDKNSLYWVKCISLTRFPSNCTKNNPDSLSPTWPQTPAPLHATNPIYLSSNTIKVPHSTTAYLILLNP